MKRLLLFINIRKLCPGNILTRTCLSKCSLFLPKETFHLPGEHKIGLQTQRRPTARQENNLVVFSLKEANVYYLTTSKTDKYEPSGSLEIGNCTEKKRALNPKPILTNVSLGYQSDTQNRVSSVFFLISQKNRRMNQTCRAKLLISGTTGKTAQIFLATANPFTELKWPG